MLMGTHGGFPALYIGRDLRDIRESTKALALGKDMVTKYKSSFSHALVPEVSGHWKKRRDIRHGNKYGSDIAKHQLTQ